MKMFRAGSISWKRNSAATALVVRLQRRPGFHCTFKGLGMLNKKYRISNKKDYNFIYKNGKKIQSRYIIVFMTANNLDYNRFGIVTSKKVGNAVLRNQSKRRLRSIVQLHLPDLKKGFDLVIVARFNIKEALFAALENDFLSAVKKAKLV